MVATGLPSPNPLLHPPSTSVCGPSDSPKQHHEALNTTPLGMCFQSKHRWAYKKNFFKPYFKAIVVKKQWSIGVKRYKPMELRLEIYKTILQRKSPKCTVNDISYIHNVVQRKSLNLRVPGESYQSFKVLRSFSNPFKNEKYFLSVLPDIQSKDKTIRTRVWRKSFHKSTGSIPGIIWSTKYYQEWLISKHQARRSPEHH